MVVVKITVRGLGKGALTSAGRPPLLGLKSKVDNCRMIRMIILIWVDGVNDMDHALRTKLEQRFSDIDIIC